MRNMNANAAVDFCIVRRGRDGQKVSNLGCHLSQPCRNLGGSRLLACRGIMHSGTRAPLRSSHIPIANAADERSMASTGEDFRGSRLRIMLVTSLQKIRWSLNRGAGYRKLVMG